MEKLSEVETAKALMMEAMAWSVMKWLREKKKVRKIADEANAALDALSRTVQERWPDGVKTSYALLVAESTALKSSAVERKKAPLQVIEAETLHFVKKMKDADDEAYRARMDAEHVFDEAERKLSTSLAREGCQKAIQAWDLKTRAIRRAEGIVHISK